MRLRSLVTPDVIGRSILIVLMVALLALVYNAVSNTTPRIEAQGTYEMVKIVDEMWDVNAPCFNSGNCNFSCGPATAGRSCFANICSGLGNGDSAYLNHSEYTCTYTPPAACPSGQIGIPPNCRFPTCADNPSMDGCSCSATNACGQSASGSYNGGSCSVAAPAVSDACPNDPGLQCSGPCSPPPPTCGDYGLLGTYPNCYAPPADPTCADYGLLGTYPNCYAAPTCADSGQLGTYPNCYAPPADPTCADSGQLGTYPNCYADPGGGTPVPTATLTANPNPASGNTALTWTSTNATSCTGVGTSFSTGGATSGTDSTVTPGFTYQVQCTGPGGNTTAQVVVGVTGGVCSGAGPITITATPNRVQPGGSSTIAWTGSNVSACTLRNLTTNTNVDASTATSCSVNDSLVVSNIQAQTTYRLTCDTQVKDVVVNLIPRYEEF